MTFDRIKNDDQRKIVLAGKKGSGKSTIANMLVQGNIFANNRTTLGGSLSLDLRVDVLDGREWSVCDITGLGFLGEPDSKAWIAAQMMLNQVCGEGGKGREGFDIICFVIEKEMAAKKNEVTNMLWNNFISLFGGAEKCFAVIITHFDIDEPPSVWLKENKKALKSIYGDVSFIASDFMFIPEDPNLHFDHRATALKSLESNLRKVYQDKTPIDPRNTSPKREFWNHSQPASIDHITASDDDDNSDNDFNVQGFDDDSSTVRSNSIRYSESLGYGNNSSFRNVESYGNDNSSSRNVESYGGNSRNVVSYEHGNSNGENIETYGYGNISTRNVASYEHGNSNGGSVETYGNGNISTRNVASYSNDMEYNYKCEQ